MGACALKLTCVGLHEASSSYRELCAMELNKLNSAIPMDPFACSSFLYQD